MIDLHLSAFAPRWRFLYVVRIDAYVCTVSIHDLGVVLTIESAQPKLCEIHNVLYSNTDSFTISERNVTISYICNEKRWPYNHIVEFYILQNDIEFWNELSNAFGK